METSTPAFSFRLGPFPVEIRGSFFVLSAVLALGAGRTAQQIAAWLFVVFVSVLWHELGHATVAATFGHRSRIELYAMGGLTHHRGPVLPWHKNVAVSLAGPGAGLLLGAAVWLAAREPSLRALLGAEVIRSALWVNVGWSFVNLLPVLPYDGGQAFQAVMSRIAPARAHVISQSVSLAVALGAAAFSLSQRLLWCAYLAGTASISAFNALRHLRAERGLKAAWQALLSEQRSTEALAAAEAVIDRATGPTLASAAELMAWAFLHQGNVPAARAAVERFPSTLQPSALLRLTLDAVDGKDVTVALASVDPSTLEPSWRALVRSWLAQGMAFRSDTLERACGDATKLPRPVLFSMTAAFFYAGAFEPTARLCDRAFAAHGHPDDAYNAACAYSRLGDSAKALSWLERALGAGYRDLEQLRADPDLAAARSAPGFESLLVSAAG